MHSKWNGGLGREILLFQFISGKSRLVKYYDLARKMLWEAPRPVQIQGNACVQPLRPTLNWTCPFAEFCRHVWLSCCFSYIVGPLVPWCSIQHGGQSAAELHRLKGTVHQIRSVHPNVANTCAVIVVYFVNLCTPKSPRNRIASEFHNEKLLV